MEKNNSFYNLETIGGLILFVTAVLALLIANSPLHPLYQQFLEYPILNHSTLHWVNDGLMAIYFLLIGLEIKREMNRGVLSNKKEIAIPAITALSGMLFPAMIFLIININHPAFLKGWAIPTATDIAFTLGIIALLGSRVPLSLKIVVTAVAIFDDMGAIAIIAFFYTATISWWALLAAIVITLALVALNLSGNRRLFLYLILGAFLWGAVVKSGIHSTIAGIIFAMTIPDDADDSILARLENTLHPWIIFLILPLFAFTNAGFNILDFHRDQFFHPIVIGVALGLFIGKQIGVALPLVYFVKKRRYLSTEGITLSQIYGIALLCGVGFTMSLFIGSLAYQQSHPNWMPLVKIGVLIGSLTSGVVGFIVLKKAHIRNNK